MVAAFLADLNAAYGGWSFWSSRAASPLVLLDNVAASPVGTRFLELVLESRDSKPGHSQPKEQPKTRPDPLVIVACGSRQTLQIVSDADQGRMSVLGSRDVAGATVCQVNLTPLQVDDVRAMLDKADPRRLPEGVAETIARLTGGLPLGAHLLTQAATLAASARPDARVTMSGLLDLESPALKDKPAGTVASRLLEALIPDQTQLAHLMMLSCALDPSEAKQLAEKYLPEDTRDRAVADVQETLSANSWTDGSGHFVPDPFLRVLLLHQLGSVSGTPDSAQAHGTLREQYPDDETGTISDREQMRLYHCLALGEAIPVAERLHDSFDMMEPADWLRSLVFVAAAPCGTRLVMCRETALGAHDNPKWDKTKRSITRLLHAAWYLNDPLVAPERRASAKSLLA